MREPLTLEGLAPLELYQLQGDDAFACWPVHGHPPGRGMRRLDRRAPGPPCRRPAGDTCSYAGRRPHVSGRLRERRAPSLGGAGPAARREQLERESRGRTRGAQPKLAAQAAREVAADGQPEAEPSVGTWLTGTLEALEDALSIAVRDPRSPIGHGQLAAAPAAGRAHRNRRAGRREAQRVVEQDAKDLRHGRGVAERRDSHAGRAARASRSARERPRTRRSRGARARAARRAGFDRRGRPRHRSVGAIRWRGG